MPVDHYENFPVASLLLPRRLHAPVTALYAFARSADDIADEGELPAAERLRRLDEYAAQLERIAAGQPCAQPLFQRLAAAVHEHRLPLSPLHDLLDAFRQDVVQTRYATHAKLLDYCRRSANPVGRLLLCLYRAETPQHLRWSDAICSSLQLINHWQDVAIDFAKSPGRIYLPQEDLEAHGVTEELIAAALRDGPQRMDERWRSLMAFEVRRARELMLSGAPLGRALPGRIGLELRLIIAGGLRILDKIEAVDYDVFHRRPVLRAHDWPLLLWQAVSRQHCNTAARTALLDSDSASDSPPR
ncbi:putative terpenoid synthase-related protein [Sterolibacterium denitrificans]|uniref:Terpenoid synthase-related protein n=1 Tax=Sterolibacterium denitrificans TaxID=157592 RepID=A0A7Z7HRM4_9PROT|nr:squalene synthase HpnC [Sterolibacterium denitrificans]SMB27831.1 putative terpenoid synthase-related protein [Sterolibacterium denitrificans]